MERLTYKASKGMTYKRKVDGHIMGNELYLGLFIDGTEDTIDNYEEVVDESIAEVTAYGNNEHTTHFAPTHPLFRLIKAKAEAEQKQTEL